MGLVVLLVTILSVLTFGGVVIYLDHLERIKEIEHKCSCRKKK